MTILRRVHLCVLLAATLGALAVPAVAPAQPAVTILNSFAGVKDAAAPVAALIQATDGNFYGTTLLGGASGQGTVFKMTPAGTVTVLHVFAGGTDGAQPAAALIQATDGNFYGTTESGGASGKGTVFRMTPSGTVTVLHAFSGGADGSLPVAPLIQATDGNFYGTASAGGASGNGTVFKMTPSGTVTVLYAFTGGADGGKPEAPLIQATDGNFYGTTDGGTVFRMTPSGTLTTLSSIGGNPNGLVQATDGNFYGTTRNGGGLGTVYRMTSSGTVTLLHSFTRGGAGITPNAALIQATDGNLYGTTSQTDIGVPGGTVFQMTPSGTVTVLHTFTTGADGSSPYAALLQAVTETSMGRLLSALGCLVAACFSRSRRGTFTPMHAFTGAAIGAGAPLSSRPPMGTSTEPRRTTAPPTWARRR